MATHSSILACRIPLMEELGGLQSTGCKELDTTKRLHFIFTKILHSEKTPYVIILIMYIRRLKTTNTLPYVRKQFSYIILCICVFRGRVRKKDKILI